MSQMYANIIVDISHEKLDRVFQYAIPSELVTAVSEGVVVRMPFGRGDRLIKGYVIEVTDTAVYETDKIKTITEVLSDEKTVETRLITLASWIRRQYGSTMIQALKTVLPIHEKVKEKQKRQVKLLLTAEEAAAKMQDCLSRHRVAQARILAALLDQPLWEYEELAAKVQITQAPLHRMQELGWLEICARRVYRLPEYLSSSEERQTVVINLNEEQRLAVEQISAEWNQKDRPVLLFGVTGSGKTEVYMQMIEDVIAQEREAIVLVPEIALTYQLVTRFQQRFGELVSFLHSRMSEGERYDQFTAARQGQIRIMVGPRSALFTPFSHLGLIIVDEEHESSYRSESMPRYHAREVAQERARLENAHLMLGSATPSLTSYKRAMEKTYRLARLSARFGKSMLPQTEIVDLKTELKEGNRSIISRRLHELIRDRLNKQEQVLLFLNRRGYAGFVSCRSCGQVIKCPHCDVSLTEHRDGRLVCHYCGYEQPMVSECPTCHSTYIGGFKAGTQQIETMVRELFPAARVLRMDADSTKGKDGHAKILKAFSDHEADILIGTQMIVKGHDFPNVTLVGVLAADLSLNEGDYASSERTFQLITQAVGRAGRSTQEGMAVIQTYQPEHYAITAAAEQNYEHFYEEEIAYRDLMSYPPSASMMAILGTSRDETQLVTAMDYICKYIRRIYPGHDLAVIGPADDGIRKVNDIYKKVIYCKHHRYGILSMIRDELDRYIQINSGFRRISVQFDFNR